MLQPGVHGNPDFPFSCPAGTVGDDPTLQTNPGCARLCPAGSWCGAATVVPTRCRNGTFCAEASPAPTDCPAGTYGPRAGLTTRSGCLDCPPGSSCGAGSARGQRCRGIEGQSRSRARSGRCAGHARRRAQLSSLGAATVRTESMRSGERVLRRRTARTGGTTGCAISARGTRRCHRRRRPPRRHRALTLCAQTIRHGIRGRRRRRSCSQRRSQHQPPRDHGRV